MIARSALRNGSGRGFRLVGSALTVRSGDKIANHPHVRQSKRTFGFDLQFRKWSLA
jgi:hypothetical protein